MQVLLLSAGADKTHACDYISTGCLQIKYPKQYVLLNKEKQVKRALSFFLTSVTESY